MNTPTTRIEPVSGCTLQVEPGDWPFAKREADRIERHWLEARDSNPALWNGRILRARQPVLSDGHLEAKLVETDFAAYLAWRDWGFPDPTHYSVFGSAVIRSREGHLLFGKMGDHTSSAGMIYPPGGSLEPGDTETDGSVDIFKSLRREMEEETGLTGDGAVIEGDLVVWWGQLISVTRVFRYDAPASELLEQIRDNICTQENAELADMVVLKTTEDIDKTATKPYAIATAEYLFEKAK